MKKQPKFVDVSAKHGSNAWSEIFAIFIIWHRTSCQFTHSGLAWNMSYCMHGEPNLTWAAVRCVFDLHCCTGLQLEKDGLLLAAVSCCIEDVFLHHDTVLAQIQLLQFHYVGTNLDCTRTLPVKRKRSPHFPGMPWHLVKIRIYSLVLSLWTCWN